MRVAFIGLAVAMLHLGATTASPLANQSQVRVGVDADPSGNTATSISDVQDCREADLDDSFQIDVFIKDVSNLDGLQFDLIYDPAIVNVTGVDVDSDSTFLSSGSSGPLIDLTKFDDAEAMVDTDGTFTVAAADFGDTESGEGVLARISLRAVGTGQSDLALVGVTISSPTGLDEDGNPDPVAIEGVITTNAAVAVEASCEAPDQPTPAPSATDATADPGGTADPDATAGSGGTAGPGGLAGSIGPDSGGTIDGDNEPGNGTSGNGDDDSNSTTWIVIGIAAGVAALIAVGGTIAWQRGKQD